MKPNNASQTNLTKIPTAAEFAERFRGIDIDFARDLVAALDVKPQLIEELLEEGFDREVLGRLERFGRGQIHPSLVYSTTPGGIKLGKLPLAEQRLLLDSGVEVLDQDETTTRVIPVHDLNKAQAALVFGGGKVRSITEQRTLIRKKKFLKAPASPGESWRVSRDHVTTDRPGKWPKSLILQWLAEMG